MTRRDGGRSERNGPSGRNRWSGSRSAQFAWVLGLLLVASSLGARSLHTYLTHSNPPADAEMPTPVEEVRLGFSTPVQRALSAVTVTDPEGFSIPAGEVVPVPDGGDDEFRVIFRDPLPEGSYVVRWQTVGPDDHPVQGSFSFSVVQVAEADQLDVDEDALRAPDREEAPSTPGATALEDGERGRFTLGQDARFRLGVRWLHYLAIIGMIGTVIFRIAVVRPISRPAELRELGARALARTRTLAWIMGILGLVVLLPRLFLQSWSIFGGIRPGQLATIAFETSWGIAWIVQAFFTAVFIVGLAMTGAGARNARGWGVMTLGALGVAFIPALSGHAWSADEMRATVVLTTYFHVVAAGIWMGGLLTLLFAGLPSLRRGVLEEGVREDAGRKHKAGFIGLSSMVNAFSRVAILAVVLLVITGLVGAWVHVDSFEDLISSGYGRTLLVKVFAAACAFALGFYNWKVVRPSLRERQEPGILRIPASMELFIGFLVLVITAVLVSQSLPGG